MEARGKNWTDTEDAELRERIAEKHRHLVFRVGEVKEIDGFRWRITGLQKNRMHLKLLGPVVSPRSV